MFNPLALLSKAKNGALSMDEVREVLAMAGMTADFGPVQVDQELPAFQGLAESASLPSHTLVKFRVQMKGGQVLQGLLVAEPEQ